MGPGEEDSSAFVERYRPRKFSDLAGQSKAVAILSHLAKNRMTTPIILSGPKGSGKTSLARIFGLSFKCSQPEKDGSPCGECTECRSSTGYEEVTYWGRESLRSVGIATGGGILSHYRIFFFDEAHRLSDAPDEELLTALENVGSLTIFIFSTTDASRIPGPIISRCKTIYTSLIDDQDAEMLAKRIAANEGLKINDDVLRLIVEVSAGDARSLVHKICDVKTFGISDLATAQSHFGFSGALIAMELLMAVIKGASPEALLTTSERSKASPEMLQSTIHELLNHIYKTQYLNLAQHPTKFDSIPSKDKEAVSGFIEELAMSASVDLGALWEKLVYFWDPVQALTKAALESRIVRFRRMLQDARASALNLSVTVQRSQPGTGRNGKHRNPSQRHLNFDQVRALWNAGSFLVQEYGVPLNGLLEIAWSDKVPTQKAASAATTKLLHGMVGALKRWSAADQHHAYMYVQEASALAYKTVILLHIHESLINDLVTLVHRRLADNGTGSFRWEANQRTRLKKHRQLLRYLVGGLDPEIEVGDASGLMVPLVDALKIPREYRREVGRLEIAQRFRVSEAIGREAISIVKEEKMSPLSVLDDEAWHYIDEDWELKEYRDRLLERNDRFKRESQMLEASRYSSCGDPLEIESFLQSRLDAKARRRSWVGWWISSKPNK